jgi:hypothetical protein
MLSIDDEIVSVTSIRRANGLKAPVRRSAVTRGTEVGVIPWSFRRNQLSDAAR